MFLIIISLKDGEVVLEYRDNGPGYPEEIWQAGQYNVGLGMVQHMVRETLRGELSLHNDDGAVTIIRFPLAA